MLPRSLLCLAVLGASTPWLADTVCPKNGDKLSGKITAVRWQAADPTEYAERRDDRPEAGQDPDSDQELLVKQEAYNG